MRRTAASVVQANPLCGVWRSQGGGLRTLWRREKEREDVLVCTSRLLRSGCKVAQQGNGLCAERALKPKPGVMARRDTRRLRAMLSAVCQASSLT